MSRSAHDKPDPRERERKDYTRRIAARDAARLLRAQWREWMSPKWL